MTDLATHCETVHVHWCVHAASSCLQILLIPYCWSVALEKKINKKKFSVIVGFPKSGHHYTWTCMHTITKSQLYTAETLVLVGVLYLKESDTSGAMTDTVDGMRMLVLVGRMQD